MRPIPFRDLGPATATSMLLLLAMQGAAAAGGIWHLGKSATPPAPSSVVKNAASDAKGLPGASKADEAPQQGGASEQAQTPAAERPAEAAEQAGAAEKAEQSASGDAAAELAKDVTKEVVKEAVKEAVKAVIDAGEKEPEKADPSKPAEKTAAGGEAEQGKDYYRKRAETILKGEGALVNGKQHPLAAASPGMDVVVCEAGCRTTAAEIVYTQPSTRKSVTTVSELQPTAAAAAAGTAGPQIVCVGGCYEGSRRLYTAPTSMTVGIGEWTTSVNASAKANPAGSGDWMRRIDETQPAQPARPSAAQPKP